MVTPGSQSGSSTAVHEECSMWVMPISGFIKLDKLQPHQILRSSNKIVQYNQSMPTVFFLSHQCVVSLFCCVAHTARNIHNRHSRPYVFFSQVDRF